MLCRLVGFKTNFTATANNCALTHFPINKVVLKTSKKTNKLKNNLINEMHFKTICSELFRF